MPYADPANEIEYNRRWQRTRQRALRRLAQLHPEDFKRLLDEELEREGRHSNRGGGADG